MSTPSSASPPPVTSAADDFVIQLALDRGLLTAAQVDAARALVASHTDPAVPVPRLLDVLMQQGALNARRVAELLAAEFGMPMAPDLTNIRVTGDTLELVPRAVAARHRLLPISRDGHTLRVAIADPLDTDGIDALGYLLKLTIEPVVATACASGASVTERLLSKSSIELASLP
jgi:type IV pilus assembly protein PilB